MSDEFDVPPIVLGVYRHYKGEEYEVLGVGCHEETHEYFVVYKPLYEHDGKPDIWLRSYDVFFEDVKVNGKPTPRFTKIN